MVFSEGVVFHAPPLTFLERDGIHVAVDPEGPNWLATDSRGERLLRMIDGRRTLGELARRYAEAAGTELAKAWVHTVAFVQAVARQGLAAAAPFQRRPYAGRLAEAPPRGLAELWLHVTDRCNLACRHCLVSSGPGGADGLPRETLETIVRQARRSGVERFYLTGGEPFARPDAVDLLALLTGELGAEAIVLTNGTGLAAAPGLASLSKERLRFQVSLDGPDPQGNDPIRGPGSFQQALAGLDAVTGAGFVTAVTCVVTELNLDRLVGMVDLAAAHGARSLHLMWMHRRGRALASGGVPSTDRLLGLVRCARARAGEVGISLDNWDSILHRVNAPAGVKHDLGNLAWDSLCIGPAGKVYPSAALVGEPALELGDATVTQLDTIWRDSPVARELREMTLIRRVEARADPLRFLTGGGDLEHVWLAAGSGNGHSLRTFLAPDPHHHLTRDLVQDALFELGARGRAACNRKMGFDAPVIFHGMGERAVACGLDVEGLELDHPVRVLHSGCVLSFDVERSRSAVREFYGHAAREPQAELCCPVTYAAVDVDHIPKAVLERFYGCGSPIKLAGVQPGESVLDLGSGGGIDCFIASRLVGPRGRVIGVDMTDAMLAVANENRPLVAANLGYDNVEFRKGVLEELPLADRSVDLVTSNCVINLSPDKKAVFAQMWRVLKNHGRAVISDIVTTTRVPPALQADARMWGECLSGALLEEEFLALLREAGFHGLTVQKRLFWKEVSGYRFFSITVRAHKFERSDAVFSGQRAMYRGPFEMVVDEEGQTFPRNQEVEVSDDTAARLLAAPYAGLFTVLGAEGRRLR